MVDIRNMATAWESRNTEVSRYDAAGASYEGADQKIDVNDVVSVLKPTYIKSVPTEDGWHNPFVCYLDQQWNSGTPAQKYVIISGRPGQRDRRQRQRRPGDELRLRYRRERAVSLLSGRAADQVV